ncbi:SUF system NifU family Fe-S cluster assembly protein [Candidatus Poribacteria bacterium]|nr:SUF system NifU family Fe-S cluster assembly protein [Candidatus Poribacteria bacterium]
MNIYQEDILDHYENPSNYGSLENPDISYEEDNPLCGDKIRMELKVDDGIITDIRFSGHGCTISRASASMLTERIKGQRLEDVKKMSKDDILEMLGIPLGPVRLKCALLSLKVLKAGVYGIKGWPGEEETEA